MSLQIRPTTYRGAAGFLVCGRPLGSTQHPRIFCRSRAVARLWRRLLMDPAICFYAPGPLARGRFWERVADGLLIAERTS